MHALRLFEGIERIATRSSRRTLVKKSLALGAATAAGRYFTAHGLAQDASPPPIPVAVQATAEWKINNPSCVYDGFGSIWVPGHHDLTTTRIDPVSNEVVAVVEGTGNHSEDALAVGNVLWVTGQGSDTNWIDPVTNMVSTTMTPVPGAYHGMAYGAKSLWIIASG